jgi:hypothetical protein
VCIFVLKLCVDIFYFAAHHGNSGPLTFHCPGNEDMIAFLEDKKSMQVCRMSWYSHQYRTISSMTKFGFWFLPLLFMNKLLLEISYEKKDTYSKYFNRNNVSKWTLKMSLINTNIPWYDCRYTDINGLRYAI